MKRRRHLVVIAVLAGLAAAAPAIGDDAVGDAAVAGCATPQALLAFEPILSRVAARIEKRETLTIVAIGSSSTEGIGASTPSRTYPSRLEAELRRRFPQLAVRVVNRGKKGEDAPEELARFDADVIAERPDLVIWQVGTNAFLRRDDWTTDGEAIRQGIERLRRSGSDVLLMDMQYAPRVIARPAHAEMQRRIADLARHASVGLFRRFDIMRHWHNSDAPDAAPTIGADGLHMTDRSYACVAAGLADAIAGNWRRYEREAERASAARVARAARTIASDDFGGGEEP